MRRVMPLTLLAAMSLSAQEQATFYAAYQDGLDAERAGRWHEAAAAFRRALALRPQPADRVFTYGNNLLVDYHPRLHLARCLVEMGELDAATGQLAQAGGEPPARREALVHRIQDLRAKAALKPKPTLPDPLPPLPATGNPVPAQTVEVPRIDPSPAERLPQNPSPTPAPKPDPAESSPAPAAPPVTAEARPAAPPPVDPQGPRPLPHQSLLLGSGALALLLLGMVWRGWKRASWRGWGLTTPPRQDSGPAPLMAGPYHLERLLGRGGFSDTFLARHGTTGQVVALKLPHPHRTDDPEFRTRFRQEAQLGALLDHPNLVRILDPGPGDGAPYLAMEYVPGESLEQRLKAEGNLPLPEAVAIGRQVAEAVAYAHAHGVVHRDLKPGNILLTDSGVKVMDLGIARVMDAATVTTAYAFLGTPLYAAPEAQFKTHVGPAADRYSLGVILFHMLAGEPPFRGETPFEILNGHRYSLPPDLHALRPEAPESLLRLVARMLDKEPDQRPEDGEIIRVLADLEAGFSAPPSALPQD